jgi:antitoxin component of MazEF toxin-antitoxin module
MIANTRIVPWGGSSGIRIPKGLLSAAHISQNDDVQIRVEADGVLVITALAPAKERYQHKTIQQRFADFSGEIPPLTEADFGEDVGAEKWQ